LDINKYIEDQPYKEYLKIAIETYNDISLQLDVLLESTPEKNKLTLELGKLAHEMTSIHHENYFSSEFQKTIEEAIANLKFVPTPIKLSFDAPSEYWRASNEANKKWRQLSNKTNAI